MEAITTIATVPAVLAGVNIFKRFGISGKWATITAIVLGVLFQLADYFTMYSGYATWQSVLKQCIDDLLLGLGASGLYDIVPSQGGVDEELSEPVIE